jgi:adenylate cyclase
MGYREKIRKIVMVYMFLLTGVVGVYVVDLWGDWRRATDDFLVATTHVDLTTAAKMEWGYVATLVAIVTILPGMFVSTLQVGRVVWLSVITAICLGITWLGVYTYFGVYFPMFYVWAGLAAGLVTALAFKLVFSSNEQEFLKMAFSQFVSPEVLKELLRDPNKLTLQGRELGITVMFVDIRGFTRFATSKTPIMVVNRLNRLLDIATHIVFKNGGTVDKYIGDAVMAFWGAPTLDKRQAANALKTAIEIRDAIAKETEFTVGVGINTGPAIVGNIGSSKRFEYTAIGDTVNVAARLEAATKDLGEGIVLAEAVVKKLAEEKVEMDGLRDKGEILVRGRSEPVHVYAI